MGDIMDDWFGLDPPKPPKVPKAEDTAETAQKFNAEQAALQAKYNLDALRTNISANRLNQNTPFGSLTYNQSGTDPFGNPTYTATTAFSPENEALLKLLQQNRGGIGEIASNYIGNFADSDIYGSDMPDLSSAISPMMDRQLDYLDPYFQHQLNTRISELRNRGLEPGNPAYDQEIMTLLQQQDRSVGNYLNTFTNTAMDLYKLPINALSAFLGMGTGPVTGADGGLGLITPPTVNLGSPTVAGVDFAGITEANQKALNELYKQELGQYNSNINMIGQGIGTILGAPTGTLVGGLTGAAGGGLANMLGLQSGNSPMRIV